MNNMTFLNKVMEFFDRWTDLCEFIARRPMDYVESFWLFTVIVPIIGFALVAAWQEAWKKEKFRVTVGCTLFFAVWPIIAVGGIIYFALGRVYSLRKTSLKKTIHKGTDTYIRFFERGKLKR